MSKHSDYEKRTEELVTPVLERLGLTLYDVEYVKEGSEYYLRIFIDNECEAVSREMNTILDEEDFIPDAYIFEVSSPGLGRTLKKDKHLSYSIGMEVDVHTFKPVDGTKDMTGILKGFDDEYVDLEIQGAEKKLERKNIASIKLTIDF